MLQFSPFLIGATAIMPVMVSNPGARILEPQAHFVPAQVGYLLPVGSTSSGNASILKSATNVAGNEGVASAKQKAGRGSATIALERLRKFAAWGDNWDGEGAPAPRLEALKSATVLLGFLSTELNSTPKVTLNGIGEPMFVVMDGDFELAVTVKSGAQVSFLVARGAVESGGLVRFDGRRLPSKMKAAINSLRFA